MSERNVKMRGATAVAYQNKDITSKILGESLKNKSFAAYGLNIPRIVDVLPTNLPVIEANELRIDNLFLLEDGSLALVDYESTYADIDKIKYLSYIIRTLKRNMKADKIPKKIRMIVIYTADIEPEQTRPRMDIGCLQFELEEAFLMNLESEEIETRLREKLKNKQALTEAEQMQFMILPLTYKGKAQKQACIRRCFELAKVIEQDEAQTFILAGMLVFADKVVTKEDSRAIKEWIMMTKVGQLFEEEKIEAVKKAVDEATKEAAKEEKIKTAKKLLSRGFPIGDILEITETLTFEEIEKLAKEIEK